MSDGALGLSLSPYTQMNYYILQHARVSEGAEVETRHELEGRGGLNRLSFAQGVRITEAFRLGATLSYYFGYTRRDRSCSY